MLATLLKDRRERERDRDRRTHGRPGTAAAAQPSRQSALQSDLRGWATDGFAIDHSVVIHAARMAGMDSIPEDRQPGNRETAQAGPGNSKHSRTAPKPSCQEAFMSQAARQAARQLAGRARQTGAADSQPIEARNSRRNEPPNAWNPARSGSGGFAGKVNPKLQISTQAGMTLHPGSCQDRDGQTDSLAREHAGQVRPRVQTSRRTQTTQPVRN